MIPAATLETTRVDVFNTLRQQGLVCYRRCLADGRLSEFTGCSFDDKGFTCPPDKMEPVFDVIQQEIETIPNFDIQARW